MKIGGAPGAAARCPAPRRRSGYSADASGQAVLAFFKGGNRVSLEMLRDRFASGPIDWTEKLKQPLK